MKFKNRAFFAKLGFAVSGWRHAWRFEVNFRRQGWVAMGVFLVLVIFHAPLIWWMLAAFSIGLVLALELVNTAVEELVDLLSPEYRKRAGRIKDLMAGAVLVAAIVSLVIAGGLLWTLFNG